MGILKKKEIAFIGAGNMAEAILGGLLGNKALPSGNITLGDPSEKRLAHLKKKYGTKTTKSNCDAAKGSDIVILAVKPQVMANVLDGLKDFIPPEKLVISIAAGITTSFIKERLGKKTKVVRVMPNTPALVGMGISAVSAPGGISKSHMSAAKEIMNTVGKTLFLDERYLNAVTGLSGSGPAYFFLMIEALIEGGVASGLSRNVSKELAVETARGAAALLVETGKDPATLREMVTSPGGTTVAGLKVLEDGAVRPAFKKAVKAATARSKELSGK